MKQTTPDESKIRELMETWARAVEEHDLNQVLARHSPDILMFDVPTTQLQGMEAYKESWKDFFGWLGGTGKFELRNLDVTAGTDVPFCVGILECAGTGQGPGLTVRLSVGLKKIDDQWTVMHEHHSVASVASSNENKNDPRCHHVNHCRCFVAT
jgi:ketosteroid isomerase-like protein